LIALEEASPRSTTEARPAWAPTAPGRTAMVEEIEDAATIRNTFSNDTGMS
jgi:hypothetical protein